jgi:hypothetical protein
LQSFSAQLVKFITKSELVVMYVKQFSQPLTNLISECAQYAAISNKHDNIAKFWDVSNEFFNISEKKEMFSDNPKRPLSFSSPSTEKSFKENVPNFPDFNLRRLNYCWFFLDTSNRDPSFLVIYRLLEPMTAKCLTQTAECFVGLNDSL